MKKTIKTAQAEASELTQLLSADVIEEMKTILTELADDKLPSWHSECDAYCTKEMKQYENRIDELLKSI